jgi:hypothetical protein
MEDGADQDEVIRHVLSIVGEVLGFETAIIDSSEEGTRH